MTLTGLADGDYTAYFFEPQRGAWLGESNVEAKQGMLTLSIPALSSDLAVKVAISVTRRLCPCVSWSRCSNAKHAANLEYEQTSSFIPVVI